MDEILGSKLNDKAVRRHREKDKQFSVFLAETVVHLQTEFVLLLGNLQRGWNFINRKLFYKLIIIATASTLIKFVHL